MTPTTLDDPTIPAPISTPRAALMGAATIAIAARLTDPVHGGFGLNLPEPAYTPVSGALLAAATAVGAWGVAQANRGTRLRLRSIIEPGGPDRHDEQAIGWTWNLLGVHAAPRRRRAAATDRLDVRKGGWTQPKSVCGKTSTRERARCT